MMSESLLHVQCIKHYGLQDTSPLEGLDYCCFLPEPFGPWWGWDGGEGASAVPSNTLSSLLNSLWPDQKEAIAQLSNSWAFTKTTLPRDK